MKARTVPIKLRDKLSDELHRLVSENILTPIYHSKWASPIVVVYKKDGSLRLVGDFSPTVNLHLDPVQSPLPTVDDTITYIGSSRFFSKIDLSQAFLQLPLDDYSKQFTVISTPFGLYQYNYLCFGLTASPGIFQAFLTETLSNISNVIVYQDDILILTETYEAHVKTVCQVLSALRHKGLKINSKKCTFLCQQVEYLGHVFDKDGVHPNPDKVKCILDAPSPQNIKQVQAFVGLCNYYSRFLPKFSQTLQPLYSLLKKDVKFHWGTEQQESFERIKRLFVSNNVLQHYNPNYQLKLETDSSGYGLGCCLLTRPDEDHPWLPIQFCSRTLNSSERNYSNIEREALSVVFGLEKFKHYLLGSKFIIANDQKPLHRLFARDKPVPTTCSARIQRWALKLSQFNYEFLYSPGKDNVNSDCFSRLPLSDTVTETEPYEIIFALNIVNNSIISCEDIRIHTDSDPNCFLLKQYIKTGCPHKIDNPLISNMRSLIPELTITKGCIMYQNRVFIPPSLRSKVLHMFHENHPGIVAMKQLARSVIWYPGMDKDVSSIVSNCHICQMVRNKPPSANITWAPPTRNFGRIHIDHFFFQNSVYFISIDAKSKWIDVHIVPTTSSSDTIDALSSIFASHGLPDEVVSDNAKSFTSFEFKDFLSSNNIKHTTPPPYCPASNGQAERAVGIIKSLLKKAPSNISLQHRLSKVLLQYRSTPHSVTKIAPSVGLNSRKLITLKDKINPLFNSTCDKQYKVPHFQLNSAVLASPGGVSMPNKWVKGIIIDKIATNMYEVRLDESGVVWRRHVNQLLPIPNDHSSDHMKISGESNDAMVRRSNRSAKSPDRLTYY